MGTGGSCLKFKAAPTVRIVVHPLTAAAASPTPHSRITGECADATAPDVSCSNAATSCNAGQILVNGTCTDW